MGGEGIVSVLSKMLFKTSKLGTLFGYVLSPTSEELIAFSPTKRHFNLLQCVPSWYNYDKLGGRH